MKPLSTIALAYLSLFGLTVLAADETPQNSVKKPYDQEVKSPPAKSSSPQILYHGGPVIYQPSVYVIYYGSFASSTEAIINNFLYYLSGTSQYDVNTGYYENPGPVYISSIYTFMRPKATTNPSGGYVYYDNYSEGNSLGSNNIPKIVANAIAAQQGLPSDPNGVYLVLTSPDVKVSGFCNSYCAYHNTSTSISNGLHIRYALIPDPTQKCSACNGGIAVYGDQVTPNGDMGADTMTDDIMHELSETVTDPDINAWYTQNGAEVGDLCNYVYANTLYPIQTTTVNGSTTHYNITLHGLNYLVQFIWKNSNPGVCSPQ